MKTEVAQISSGEIGEAELHEPGGAARGGGVVPPLHGVGSSRTIPLSNSPAKTGASRDAELGFLRRD